MADNSISDLKQALGFGVSVITAEHFISAGMSSPWSTAKFAKSEQDQAQVWKLFREAAYASIVSSAIVALLLKDSKAFLWSMAGTGGVLLLIGSEYKRALAGQL